jgi:small-conductance mechanosensitive channel
MLILLMVISVAGGITGCKGKEKVSKKKTKAEYEARVNQAKEDLTAIIDGTTRLSLDAQEKRVNEIKEMNIDDDDVQGMISQAEQKIADQRSALVVAEIENKKKQEQSGQTSPAGTSLTGYFSQISKAGSVNEANMLINEALKMFSSPDVPVLVIISKTNEGVDYDRPTTIKDYLNYLKDTKNNINKVEKISYDSNGKIKELELIKIL